MPAVIESEPRPAPAGEQETRFSQAPVSELLPVQERKGAITSLLANNSRVLVVGETGSGKTTWIPRYLLDALSLQRPDARVIVTQPKKIAVSNVAETVRKQIGPELVGYRYKNANTITDKTKIAFMVDGSLVNELLRNPMLEGWDAVMVDEVHEETEDMLFELALLKKAQELRAAAGKRSLTIVVTSGTVDVAKIQNYLPGIVTEEVPGRQHEIVDNYATQKIEPEDIVPQAVATVEQIFKETTDGDVLVFMPGRSHIDSTIRALKDTDKFKNNSDVSFFAITGGEQDRTVDINAKAPKGKRRVFVATDAAQTSITIKGIKDVVISGLKKVSTYNPFTGMAALRLADATRTDITQQRGRAGRDDKGRAWYLVTKGEYESRPEFETSEITRSDLTRLVLRIIESQEDPHNFDFMTKPPRSQIDAAITALQNLGAVDVSGKITEIGRQMETIPTDPRLARMLVEAKKRGCVEAVSVLVGFLSTGKSVYAYNPATEQFAIKYANVIKKDSDYLTLLNVWNAYVLQKDREKRAWAQAHGFSPSVLYQAMRTKNELLSEDVFEELQLSSRNEPVDLAVDLANASLVDAIQKSVVAGLVDRVLTIRADGVYTFADGKSGVVSVDRSSVVSEDRANMIVAGGLRQQEKGGVYASWNQKVTPQLIAEVAPYLEPLKRAKEAAEQEEKVAAAAAEAIVREHRERLQESRPVQEAVVSPVVEEKKLSFIEQVKQGVASFFTRIRQIGSAIFNRIKKFFRIK
ncbi:MAG: ATP-dependent RNA helicase [Candidatus Levybacteria bacterium]|nr:ATP-dependent RNA helicase [Candidatus Levybacteria bacterium]